MEVIMWGIGIGFGLQLSFSLFGFGLYHLLQLIKNS